MHGVTDYGDSVITHMRGQQHTGRCKGASVSLPTTCRFIFVLDGLVDIALADSKTEQQLHADDFAYFPADTQHSITSGHGAGLLVFERRYALHGRKSTFQSGSTQEQPVLPVPGRLTLYPRSTYLMSQA